jgi:hypothetical protein
MVNTLEKKSQKDLLIEKIVDSRAAEALIELIITDEKRPQNFLTELRKTEREDIDKVLDLLPSEMKGTYRLTLNIFKTHFQMAILEYDLQSIHLKG